MSMTLAVFPWSGKYDCTESLTLTHINELTCIPPVQQISEWSIILLFLSGRAVE